MMRKWDVKYKRHSFVLIALIFFTLSCTRLPVTVVPTVPQEVEPTDIAITATVAHTALPEATPTRMPVQFGLQSTVLSGRVIFLDGIWIQSCDGMWAAGEVFDRAGGVSLVGVLLHFSGPGIDKYTFSGSATQYGESGFEVQLSDIIIETHGEFWVTVEDEFGNPMSPDILFDTGSDCNSNLSIIVLQGTDNG